MSSPRSAPVNERRPSSDLKTTLASGDPAPLTVAQLRALARGVGFEFGWALRAVSRELRGWRELAERIPDPILRADAVDSLDGKGHFNYGVALFGILLDRRDPRLLRALVAFQITANFLDVTSERAAAERGDSGGSLMLAFVDAVDVEGGYQDYYADHPWSDDGGFLRALVAATRAGCATLPHYEVARPLLLREARRERALEVVHDPQAVRRDDAVRCFAHDEYGSDTEAAWFELAAGATNGLAVVVLLALAADPGATADDLWASSDAYVWVAVISTMLDSFVDQADDVAKGDWSAIESYPSDALAVDRLTYLVDRSLREVSRLRNGDRHAVIVSAMFALLLSRDTARSEPLRRPVRRMVRAGGSLTRLLVPTLRAWRVAFRLRGA